MKKAGIIAFLSFVLLACNTDKKSNPLPLSYKIEAGDFCFLIQPSKLQEKEASKFSSKLQNFLQNFNVTQILSLKYDSVFVVSDLNKWTAYTSFKDNALLQSNLNIWSKDKFVFQDSLADFAMYNYQEKHLRYAVNDSILIFCYKSDIEKKTKSFLEQKTIAKKWKALLHEKQQADYLFGKFSNNRMVDNKHALTIKNGNDSLNLSLRFELFSSTTLDFKLNETENGYEKGDMYLNLHIDAEKDSIIKPWLQTYAQKIGLSLSQILHYSTGEIYYFKGGKLPVYREQIKTVMDDNFNMVEEKTLVKSEVNGFHLELKSSDKDSLISILQKSGILTENKKSYQILTQDQLNNLSTDKSFVFSTADKSTQKTESPAVFYLKQKYGNFVVDSIQNEENSFSFQLTFIPSAKGLAF